MMVVLTELVREGRRRRARSRSMSWSGRAYQVTAEWGN